MLYCMFLMGSRLPHGLLKVGHKNKCACLLLNHNLVYISYFKTLRPKGILLHALIIRLCLAGSKTPQSCLCL